MHRYLRKEIIESSGNTECLRIKQMPNVSGDIIHSLLYAGFKEVNTYLSLGPLSLTIILIISANISYTTQLQVFQKLRLQDSFVLFAQPCLKGGKAENQ